MDASKRTQMLQEAANTYRSNWQRRDASEVTMRQAFIGQAPKNTGRPTLNDLPVFYGTSNAVHNGPANTCPTNGSPIPAAGPGNGFSTHYTNDYVTGSIAAGVILNDNAWGNSGGVVLKSCQAASNILSMSSNPVLGQTQYCTTFPTSAVLQRDNKYCASNNCPPRFYPS
jgi:hypothetical protein